jgi:hypothetical protein
MKANRQSAPFIIMFLFCTGVSIADDQVAGAQLLAPFKSELKAALIEGMQSGPAEAIDACRLKAPQIAADLSVEGVQVGRSSQRLRNPGNAGPDWVEDVLEEWRAQSKFEAVIVPLTDTRTGYAEPILVAPLCLTCHGESLSPGVADRIRALYPEDRATGYQAGDLRGAFWVEYPTTVERKVREEGT